MNCIQDAFSCFSSFFCCSSTQVAPETDIEKRVKETALTSFSRNRVTPLTVLTARPLLSPPDSPRFAQALRDYQQKFGADGDRKFREDFDQQMEVYRSEPYYARKKYVDAFGEVKGLRYFADFYVDNFHELIKGDVPTAILIAAIAAKRKRDLQGLEPFLAMLKDAEVLDGEEIANYILTFKALFKGKTYCRKEETGLSHTLDFRSNGKIYVLLKGKAAEEYCIKGLGSEKSVTAAVEFDGSLAAYGVINASALERKNQAGLEKRSLFAQMELRYLRKFGGFTEEEKRICTVEEHKAIKTAIKRSGESNEFTQEPGDVLLTMVMPFASGGDFLGEPFVSLPFAKKVERLSDIANALAFMHQEGRVHRDVKLENAFLYENRAGLGDFAFTAPADRAAKEANCSLTGTPGYASPEILSLTLEEEAEAAYKADVYAFGVTLYEGLTTSAALPVPHQKEGDGNRAHYKAPMEERQRKAVQHLNLKYPGNQELVTLVEKLLSFEPAGRSSMAEAAKELNRLKIKLLS